MDREKVLSKIVLCLLGILCAASTLTAGWRSYQSGDSEQYPGVSQKERRGLLWPPFARPTGKEASLARQYHYNKYWPYPHTCEDRNSVRSAMAQQRQEGWISETTLYDLHFDPSTQQLTSSGISHLKWILYETPHQFRTVHVAGVASAEINQVRVTQVQQAASELLGNGPEGIPPVVVRKFARPSLTPAQDIDLLRRSWVSGMPSPRLAVPDSAGNSGGSEQQ